MNELDVAPQGPRDPTTANANESADQDNNDHKPRDSKGWDGKLRLDKMTLGDEPRDPHAQIVSDPESDDEGPQPEQLAADEDLLDDTPEDEDDIELVHCKVSDMASLRLERFKQMKRLCLRQNRIESIAIPPDAAATLTEIDLYDNLISSIKNLEPFTNVTSLDLSFNKIRHIKRLSHLTQLKDLYFVQNKISKIENLEGLTHLRQLELGANRVREIEGLDTLTGLEELWLGKNKITEIRGLDTLKNLKILSIQSNRLHSLSGLSHLTALEELHISHNILTSLSGLSANINLRVIDISANPIEHLSGLHGLLHLQEFWASNCKLSDFAEVERELRDKQELETVYFEGNPLQRQQPALYRNKIRLALPRVVQIDASKLVFSYLQKVKEGKRS
ncbi:L domain-like protein [Plenodomus tracheiphilus IPT5]|uniref:L domain-like protein n=1 Tax=Plenodomus tracheiphilus IPT5 TaxID=1408161 RepID=A0A6A7AQV5_9PLEO|nr:L domain-like protein [Plenodomus tracheiphilus IPT5]